MNSPPENDLEGRIARMGRGMLYLFWLSVAALLTWGFQLWLDGERNPNRDPDSLRVGSRTEVRLLRNSSNHYVTSGTINGQGVEFLLDTGATLVAVPERTARRLGLERGPVGQSLTANGLVDVYYTRIDRLTIGAIELTDVPASILPSMGPDEEILLGMSALGRVDWRQESGELVLVW